MFDQDTWEALVRAYAEGEECPLRDYILEHEIPSDRVWHTKDPLIKERPQLVRQYLAHIDAHTETSKEAKDLLARWSAVDVQLARLSDLYWQIVEIRNEVIPF